jgi:hypothetical protein
VGEFMPSLRWTAQRPKLQKALLVRASCDQSDVAIAVVRKE